jgi:hypothetical protein
MGAGGTARISWGRSVLVPGGTVGCGCVGSELTGTDVEGVFDDELLWKPGRVVEVSFGGVTGLEVDFLFAFRSLVAEVLEAAMAGSFGLEGAEVEENVEGVADGIRGFGSPVGAETSAVPLLVGRRQVPGRIVGGSLTENRDEDGPSASLSLEKPAPKLLRNWSEEIDLVPSGSGWLAVNEVVRWWAFTKGELQACMARMRGDCSWVL